MVGRHAVGLGLRVVEEGLFAVPVPQRHVEVAARPGPGVVRLGHERQAVAVQPGDLLGPVLEQDRLVGHLQDVGVVDVHLVLAGGGLALGELDRDAGLGHQVPEPTMDGLALGALQEVVVLVVVAESLQAAVALGVGLLVGIGQEVVLVLRAGHDPESVTGGPLDDLLEDGARRDGNLVAVVVDRVGQDDGRPLQPRHLAVGVPHRIGDPVPVAGLPVHQREPVRGVHLHVGAEQVRAEVGAVVDGPVQERLALDPLAHEPTLHVGQGHDQRVDPPLANGCLQLIAPGMGIGLGHGSSCGRSGIVRGSGERCGPAGWPGRPAV